MKSISICTISALCLSTTFAHAGGLAPTVNDNDQVIVVPEASKGSAASIIVPLLVLGLIAAASGASSTNDGGDGGEGDRILF